MFVFTARTLLGHQIVVRPLSGNTLSDLFFRRSVCFCHQIGVSFVLDGDLAESIQQLKQEPGKNIVALGGAGFMRSLIDTGLIDEYQLAVHPVALGAGLPIFTGLAKPLDLKLVEVKGFPGGIVAYNYLPA